MPRNVPRIVASIALLVAGGALGWIAHRRLGPADEKEHADDGDQHEPGSLRVKVVTAAVEHGSLPILATLVGAIEADPAALRTISGRAGGRVLEVRARKGQVVRAGEVLVRFEKGPLEAALLQQKSLLAAATSQRSEFELTGRARTEGELVAAEKKAASEKALALAQLERMGPLQAEGLVASKALADARFAADRAQLEHENAARAAAAWRERGAAQQLLTLQAAEAAAAAAVAEAEKALAEADLAAPADGRVLALEPHAGDRCEGLAPLGTLLVGDRRVAVLGATPELARKVAIGARATWTEPGGVERAGSVETVAARVGSDGLVDVVVGVAAEPAGSPPLPGQPVRAEVEIGRTEEAALVPAEALLREGDELYVVLRDAKGLARRAEVKVLARGPAQVAVAGELVPGARVVTSGGFHVPAGAALVEDTPPTESRK